MKGGEGQLQPQQGHCEAAPPRAGLQLALSVPSPAPRALPAARRALGALTPAQPASAFWPGLLQQWMAQHPVATELRCHMPVHCWLLPPQPRWQSMQLPLRVGTTAPPALLGLNIWGSQHLQRHCHRRYQCDSASLECMTELDPERLACVQPRRAEVASEMEAPPVPV